ncbi:MAG: hypothetical protein PHR45_00240 [Muribaculaceae bacterium]|nr:hypothetical protein [Muribaculaceae bacterium]
MKKNIILIFSLVLLVLGSCTKEHDAPGDDFPPSTDPVDPTPKPEVDYINTFYPNEVKPSTSAQCFAGAYYRKAVSSVDVWTGIEGTVVLPKMDFDQSRLNPNRPMQYLDNPSVYMGGTMGGQETDIGMTWEVIRDANGNVTADSRAFRPFMRRTKSGSQESNYSNAPAQAAYYWYPGEEITMSVRIDSKGKLKFVVEGNGKRYEALYDCAGYQKGTKGVFKRVNAIDQVANEGKPVQPTKTVVKEGEWKSTYLYRYVDGKDVKVPMHTGRFTDMRCPDVKYFKIGCTEAQGKIGGETITINGAGY